MPTPNGNQDDPIEETQTTENRENDTPATDTISMAAYKKMQTNYNRLKAQHDELTAAYAKEVEELTATKEGQEQAAKRAAELEAASQALQKQLEELTGAKSKAEADYQRAKLIMAEFPHLSGFEADGLLPTAGDPEQLRDALQKFSDRLNTQVGQGVKKAVSGSTPDPAPKSNPGNPPNEVEESADYIWDQLSKSAGRDEKEFQKWQQKWDLLHSNNGGKS